MAVRLVRSLLPLTCRRTRLSRPLLHQREDPADDRPDGAEQGDVRAEPQDGEVAGLERRSQRVDDVPRLDQEEDDDEERAAARHHAQETQAAIGRAEDGGGETCESEERDHDPEAQTSRLGLAVEQEVRRDVVGAEGLRHRGRPAEREPKPRRPAGDEVQQPADERDDRAASQAAAEPSWAWERSAAEAAMWQRTELARELGRLPARAPTRPAGGRPP